jgi:hypothetical protein
MGYVYSCPEKIHTDHDFDIEYYGQKMFSRTTKNNKLFLVEVHLKLRPQFCYAPLKEFWDSLQEKEVGGLKVLYPSDESLLVYLSLACMTITEFISLRYLYDLHSLVFKFKAEWDWKRLAEDLMGRRYKDSVYFALAMSGGLFGSPIPRHFLNKIKPGFFKKILLGLWINKNNILRRESSNTHSWYYFFSSWHYLASSYLYSNNLLEAMKLVYQKIFLPEAYLLSGFHNRPTGGILILHIHRLFKPVFRIWRKRR